MGWELPMRLKGTAFIRLDLVLAGENKWVIGCGEQLMGGRVFEGGGLGP